MLKTTDIVSRFIWNPFNKFNSYEGFLTGSAWGRVLLAGLPSVQTLGNRSGPPVRACVQCTQANLLVTAPSGRKATALNRRIRGVGFLSFEVKPWQGSEKFGS